MDCSRGSPSALITAAVALLAASALCHVSAQDGFDYGDVLKGGATFYGDYDGFGTHGGACGYQDLTAAGYGIIIAAGSGPLWKGGKGCGACYRIKCVDSPYCTGRDIVVPITDWCPGGNWCCPTCNHFDLSQPAFRLIANTVAGHVPLKYQRVPCAFQGPMRFVVTGTVWWMNVMLQNSAGPGEIKKMEVSWDGGQSFRDMRHSWGANWVYESGMPNAPLRFRLTSGMDGQRVTTPDCLGRNWVGGTYYCKVQFKSSSLSTGPNSDGQGNTAPPKRSPPPKRRAPPPKRRSPPPKRRSPPPKKRSPPPKRRAPPPKRRPPPPKRRSPPPKRRSPPPKRRPPPPKRRPPPPKRRHPPGKGRHPPGKGKHPPGVGGHKKTS